MRQIDVYVCYIGYNKLIKIYSVFDNNKYNKNVNIILINI